MSHVLTWDLIVFWFITIGGIAKGEPDRAQALQNTCCALPSRLQNDQDTLIEQSNILLNSQ